MYQVLNITPTEWDSIDFGLSADSRFHLVDILKIPQSDGIYSSRWSHSRSVRKSSTHRPHGQEVRVPNS